MISNVRGYSFQPFHLSISLPSSFCFSGFFFSLTPPWPCGNLLIMEIVDAILGGSAGFSLAGWGRVALFCAGAFIFCLPFILLGYSFERDVNRVAVVNRVLKTLVLLFFLLPFLVFALLNSLMPFVSHWEKSGNPLMWMFWVMEGTTPPILLFLLLSIFLVLYLVQIWRADLRR